MEDTNPLLASPAEHFRSLDDAIEHYLGGATWSQLWQVTFVSLAWFFDAQQMFISIFADARPKWNSGHQSTPGIALHSIVSNRTVQYSDSVATALPSTSFFLGSMVGGLLLSPLSDSLLGRKKMLSLSCLLMSVAGAVTAASTNVWIYSCLRFISGFGRAMIGSCVLVHSAELVGKKWRGKVGVVGFVFFALGFLALPMEAFLLRNKSWRFLYLSTCIPCFFYSLLLYLYVEESPRWLFVKNRKDEFSRTLKRISRRDDTDHVNESLKWGFVDEALNQRVGLFDSWKMLWQRKWARKRVLLVSAACFCVGLAYYGLPSAVGTLSFDVYIAVALNAVMEFPASLFTFVAVGKLDRRVSVFGFSALSGVCSVATAVAPRNGIQVALEVVSFTSAVTVFDLVLIYTVELFPTCVRNSAMGMARLAVNLGNASFPLLMALGRGEPWVSYGVAGVAVFACGVLVKWLPETRGREWTDLMEEEALN